MKTISERGRRTLLCASFGCSRHCPKRTEAQVLGKQVLRSGTSVGANYREAFRARSKAEFISKAGDCLREIEETAYWLELLVDGQIVSATKLNPLRQELMNSPRSSSLS